MTGTRDRMIDAAAGLLRRRGLAAMSFTDVLADSGAARGAIYHHFPGGKVELAAKAAETDGVQVRAHLAALTATTPRDVVAAFFESVRPVLALSAEGGGCAVAAVTVDVGDPDPAHARTLQDVAHGAFTSWTAALAGRLTEAGLAEAAAQDLAALLVTVLEGAHVLCRASGDLAPYERARDAVLATLN